MPSDILMMIFFTDPDPVPCDPFALYLKKFGVWSVEYLEFGVLGVPKVP